MPPIVSRLSRVLAAVVFACGASAFAAESTKAANSSNKSDEKPSAKALAGVDLSRLFADLDRDGDGRVTAAEVGTDHAALFARVVRLGDKNADGELSRDEFQAALSQSEPAFTPGFAGGNGPGRAMMAAAAMQDPAMLFRRMDANGDGRVVLEDLPEERRERFRFALARFDTNKDGALTLEEFKPFFAMMSGRPGQPPEAGKTPAVKPADGKRPEGAPAPRPNGLPVRPSNEILQRVFQQADRNGDGKLSRDEAPPRMAEFFDRIDKNADGFLDRDEILRRIGAPK